MLIEGHGVWDGGAIGRYSFNRLHGIAAVCWPGCPGVYFLWSLALSDSALGFLNLRWSLSSFPREREWKLQVAWGVLSRLHKASLSTTFLWSKHNTILTPIQMCGNRPPAFMGGVATGRRDAGDLLMTGNISFWTVPFLTCTSVLIFWGSCLKPSHGSFASCSFHLLGDEICQKDDIKEDLQKAFHLHYTIF